MDVIGCCLFLSRPRCLVARSLVTTQQARSRWKNCNGPAKYLWVAGFEGKRLVNTPRRRRRESPRGVCTKCCCLRTFTLVASSKSEAHKRSNDMADPNSSNTTQLLRAWAGGDREALDELTPRVYRELRRMAAKFLLNERPGHTLQSVDLVNEVYLKLFDIEEMKWQDRAHFFAVSATLMRRILLDRARKRLAGKRGGKVQALNLDEAFDVSCGRARELVALDDALT